MTGDRPADYLASLVRELCAHPELAAVLGCTAAGPTGGWLMTSLRMTLGHRNVAASDGISKGWATTDCLLVA